MLVKVDDILISKFT